MYNLIQMTNTLFIPKCDRCNHAELCFSYIKLILPQFNDHDNAFRNIVVIFPTKLHNKKINQAIMFIYLYFHVKVNL